MKIIEKTFNVQTGEETVIEREETQLEKETREKLEAENALLETELKAKEAAKAALLKRLGITAEEAALLLA